MKTAAEVIAGIFFAGFAMIHLIRLLCPFNLIIGDYQVPFWPSACLFVASGLLSAWLFRYQET